MVLLALRFDENSLYALIDSFYPFVELGYGGFELLGRQDVDEVGRYGRHYEFGAHMQRRDLVDERYPFISG